MRITAKKFRERVGCDPRDDDLARANCNFVGSPAHMSCGWCQRCDKPRFVCGHLVTDIQVMEPPP